MKYARTIVGIFFTVWIVIFFLYFYSVTRANDVFARLLPASWNVDGERVAKTNVLLYLALPSFSSPLLFFWLVFILAFYFANLAARRGWRVHEPSVFTGGFAILETAH